MTPADHYAEADRLLAEAHHAVRRSLDQREESIDAALYADEAERLTRFAQVHATLATVDPNRVWPLRQVPPQPKGSTGKVRMEGAD